MGTYYPVFWISWRSRILFYSHYLADCHMPYFLRGTARKGNQENQVIYAGKG